jgi:hypothetical protein
VTIVDETLGEGAMTIEEMRAEVTRLGVNLLRMCEEAIHECVAELAVERNRYHREFLEQQLVRYQEIRERCMSAA